MVNCDFNIYKAHGTTMKKKMTSILCFSVVNMFSSASSSSFTSYLFFWPYLLSPLTVITSNYPTFSLGCYFLFLSPHLFVLSLLFFIPSFLLLSRTFSSSPSSLAVNHNRHFICCNGDWVFVWRTEGTLFESPEEQ